MKTIIFSALAAIALICPSIAYAASPTPVAAATPASEGNQNIKQQRGGNYVLSPKEFSSYTQPYLLETGHLVKFSQRLHRFYAALHGEDQVEIFPVAKGVFVSPNGARIEFRDRGESLAITYLDRKPSDPVIVARRQGVRH
ncbi:hypothetical protein HSX11_03720 [Oxalobacteraceae bacterium]|nr:hypothetical protein [Oxalobacteraceae bacterium]